jgi:hypothetical protein
MKALFITEKYQDASHKELGLSNTSHNIVGSWQCAEYGSYEQVFMSPDPGDIHSSDQIVKALEEKDYDFALVAGNYSFYPDKWGIRKLLDKGKIIGMMWWDTIMESDWETAKGFADIGMQQLIFDNNVHHHNCHCLETPQDTRIFYRDANQVKDIDVSFIGSIHHDRQEQITFLQRHVKCSYLFNGGRHIGQGNIPLHDYASIHRRSKICLNFQLGRGRQQRKGRSYEIAASGGFMLSNCPGIISEWWTDGHEYISFANHSDLVAKVKRYLHDENERARIAENAYNRFMREYSPRVTWSKIIRYLGVPQGGVISDCEKVVVSLIENGIEMKDSKGAVLKKQGDKFVYTHEFTDHLEAVKTFLRHAGVK